MQRSSSFKVQNSTFIGSNLAVIEDSDGFLIENTTFKDSSSGDYGVYIKNTDSGTFKDNNILNSASDDGSVTALCIWQAQDQSFTK